jgi:hypothetical protein
MRSIICKLLLLGVAMTAQGQTARTAKEQSATQHQEVDLAVTYSTEYSNLTSGGTFWRQGGGAELSAQLFHGFGIAANVTGTHISSASGTGVPVTTVTTTFGPRYTFSRKKLALFGQGLIGESHGIDGIFPSSTGALNEWNSFALQVGGGMDWRFTRHFAVRPIQADWIKTQFPNGSSNVQNSVRLATGIVLRLGR